MYEGIGTGEIKSAQDWINDFKDTGIADAEKVFEIAVQDGEFELITEE